MVFAKTSPINHVFLVVISDALRRSCVVTASNLRIQKSTSAKKFLPKSFLSIRDLLKVSIYWKLKYYKLIRQLSENNNLF